jgi:transposase InsO family protein
VVKLKCIQADNGGEFISNDFKKWCADKRIRLSYIMPYSLEQNGIAERTNRVFNERVTAMMTSSKLPIKFWPVTVRTASHIINRSPNLQSGKSPIELFTSKKPNISNLKVFGCAVYVHVRKEEREKFDNKAVKAIFVGYEDFGYGLYEPVSGMILTMKIKVKWDRMETY